MAPSSNFIKQTQMAFSAWFLFSFILLCVVRLFVPIGLKAFGAFFLTSAFSLLSLIASAIFFERLLSFGSEYEGRTNQKKPVVRVALLKFTSYGIWAFLFWYFRDVNPIALVLGALSMFFGSAGGGLVHAYARRT